MVGESGYDNGERWIWWWGQWIWWRGRYDRRGGRGHLGIIDGLVGMYSSTQLFKTAWQLLFFVNRYLPCLPGITPWLLIPVEHRGHRNLVLDVHGNFLYQNFRLEKNFLPECMKGSRVRHPIQWGYFHTTGLQNETYPWHSYHLETLGKKSSIQANSGWTSRN